MSAGLRVIAPAPPRDEQAVLDPSPAPPTPRVSSHALLGNGREVEIVHGTQLYRLRLTALGKLILTK